MPTKKKRVGFIPREDVIKIIDKLSIDNNLSNSKIISILVEEALTNRGLFDLSSKDKIKKGIHNKMTLKSIFSNSIENSGILKDTQLDNKEDESDELFLVRKLKNYNFDFKTYEKFMLFLKFQEMEEKYDK